MPHMTPTVEVIRSNILRDIRNLLADADISENSDYYIRASTIASCVAGIYQDQGWIVRQIFADTADIEFLELHCRTRGIVRKPANTATGTIDLTGEPNATVASGLTVTRDALSFVTTQQATIGLDGKLTMTAQAATPGTGGNTAQVMSGTLSSTPDGVDTTVIIGIMRGGTDQESPEDLLARYLDLIRRPPAGGNKYDYKRWALEVTGVTAAFVYPLRRGLGTVDIVITSADGLPSETIIAATQAHIDDVRPVTAKSSLVMAPTIKTFDIDVNVTLSGITFDAAETLIKETLNNYVNRLMPGESFIRSQAEMLVSLITGVTDRQIISPINNVIPQVDGTVVEWLRVGTITVALL
ncbi:TPA: baseplate J/gp47 family protein [Yersinia enterocolitica]|uniref:baseplate J/gp47 family protein n=1 Tax=Yersinia enterocolitica TaxID=630 RepID=UPI0005DC8F68|nr:baseplate J/gp47 family protein [Yersinia enterocolitica]EKN3386801.1 baseplate J/gp47 family protein [Yersinia enterocolitica]EKN3766508.1 baseplate J/gp47 family protein [Yersinia enterocolitica]EKN3891580.1 baseplate J/gp47 family protein [Yersinia enterocolitica]EKN4083091.1 baseplate J/gp47 family protein [Yersinia enterocolitica]EKN6167128.1 baseplate J/gp47 family protein [Yersinia enterocolitica]